jgi:tRNA-splicing ligase RtcB
MMLLRVLQAMRESGLPPFKTDKEAVNCHHNYVEKEPTRSPASPRPAG